MRYTTGREEDYHIVKTWSEMPSIVEFQGESFSIRVLEHKYRYMEQALYAIVNHGLDAKQCRDLANKTLNEIHP